VHRQGAQALGGVADEQAVDGGYGHPWRGAALERHPRCGLDGGAFCGPRRPARRCSFKPGRKRSRTRTPRQWYRSTTTASPAKYAPHVDILVDDVKVATVKFALAIEFDVTGLAAVVTMGDLVALRGGKCSATATLTVDGIQVAKKTRSLDPAMTVRLRYPLRLAPKHAANRRRRPGASAVVPLTMGAPR
jgi:hypothetical protein